MAFRSLLITSALLAAASGADRSACNATWFLTLPCGEAAGALVSQGKAWRTNQCYGNQEECQYEESPAALEIRRTSLSTHKTNEIAFEFTPPLPHPFCKIRVGLLPTEHQRVTPAPVTPGDIAVVCSCSGPFHNDVPGRRPAKRLLPTPPFNDRKWTDPCRRLRRDVQ
uniref:uncharacterized protein LOC120816304 isoform X2 n=1 Tax=Gasterosteus aculeatus aculeatus TaxID=481459 RepID=UPI001A98A7AB|nr:uncharacterized protein LOC120816304 isoform X2 [Gasterosteus aculeatus aculeatus]